MKLTSLEFNKQLQSLIDVGLKSNISACNIIKYLKMHKLHLHYSLCKAKDIMAKSFKGCNKK